MLNRPDVAKERIRVLEDISKEFIRKQHREAHTEMENMKKKFKKKVVEHRLISSIKSKNRK